MSDVDAETAPPAAPPAEPPAEPPGQPPAEPTADAWEPYPLDDDTQLVAVAVERSGSVAKVTLLGPGRSNAMGPDFWRELPIVFRLLDDDESVRAVVLAGSGKNFSSGLDLTTMGGEIGGMLGEDGGLARARTRLLGLIRRLQASITAVADCRKPVAAAVQGWCIGGGVDLIAACDVRYASADAKFSIREVRVGMVADVGSLQRLPAIIGDGHLRELALTGMDVDAARAERIGLVNDVFADPDGALAAAVGFARQVAANPPLVVTGTKQVLAAARAAEVDAGLKYVAAWNSAFLPSYDLGEAMAAIMQKRPPEFTGR